GTTGAAVDAAPVVPVPDAARRWERGADPACGRRAVLRAADGIRTPVQIARALGRPAFATLLDVRRLAALGLIRTPEPVAAPAAAPRPAVRDAPEISLLFRIRDALEAL
ncbi:transcriptional regulator, partial [Streptomyces sp. ISL-11]|nr:transcriptional regulator [Streptomyces sp. ISL-11]